jgi:hypothetical protein
MAAPYEGLVESARSDRRFAGGAGFILKDARDQTP